MGRLIDEDVLLTRIMLNYNNHQNISAGAMKDIINTTPTAYDVEKVVEELENEMKFWEDSYDYQIGKEKARSYSHAIEIVKGGGVE